MRKIIISLSGALLVVFVFAFIGNAKTSSKEAELYSYQLVQDTIKTSLEKVKSICVEKTCTSGKCNESECSEIDCKEGKCETSECNPGCSGTTIEKGAGCEKAGEAGCCESQCEGANCDLTGEKCCTK